MIICIDYFIIQQSMTFIANTLTYFLFIGISVFEFVIPKKELVAYKGIIKFS